MGRFEAHASRPLRSFLSLSLRETKLCAYKRFNSRLFISRIYYRYTATSRTEGHRREDKGREREKDRRGYFSLCLVRARVYSRQKTIGVTREPRDKFIESRRVTCFRPPATLRPVGGKKRWLCARVCALAF